MIVLEIDSAWDRSCSLLCEGGGKAIYTYRYEQTRFKHVTLSRNLDATLVSNYSSAPYCVKGQAMTGLHDWNPIWSPFACTCM